MKIKTKKAIILPETLKIIIGVLCILILIYLAWSLYSLFIKKTPLEQAKETLNQIISKLNGLKEGEEDNYLLTVPKEWYLVYYDKNIVNSDANKGMPSQCKGESCLCACPFEGRGGDLEIIQPARMPRGGYPDYFYYRGDLNGLELCEKQGICQNYENIKIDKILFYKVWSGLILKEQAGYVNWIPFSSYGSIGRKIYLKKENNQAIIKEYPETIPILTNFLEKEIEFNNEKLTSENFILKYIANDCSKNDKEGKEFLIDKEAEKKIESEITVYLSELKNQGKISNEYIELYKINPDGGDVVRIYKSYPGSDPNIFIEQKKLCGGDFAFYVTIRR